MALMVFELTGRCDLLAVQPPARAQRVARLLAAALDASGDQAAFTAVSAFGQALQTGRGAVDVIPADLLGLSPGQTYDDVTIPVGSLLTNIAMTVANGEPITIPITLPEPLGDGVRITIQPGTPGSAATFTPGLQLSNSESADAAFARSRTPVVEGAFSRYNVHRIDQGCGIVPDGTCMMRDAFGNGTVCCGKILFSRTGIFS